VSRALPPEPGPDVTDLHAVTVTQTAAGFHAVCRCGSWDGWWRGERTRLWVLDDHDHHRRASSNGGNLPPVQ
jgi:hypothetical protein